MAARKAERHDLAQVRHDLRPRALKELLEQRIQQPAARTRHQHQEGRAPEALQEHEPDDGGNHQAEHRGTAERRDVERGATQPRRPNRQRRIVGLPQRPQDAIVEVLGFPLEHQIGQRRKAQEQKYQRQAADQERQFLPIAFALPERSRWSMS